MRLDGTDQIEVQDFSDWLLRIGEWTERTFADPSTGLPDLILLPNSIGVKINRIGTDKICVSEFEVKFLIYNTTPILLNFCIYLYMAEKLVKCLIFVDNIPSKTIKLRKNPYIYLFFLKYNSMIKYFRHIELNIY